MRIKQLYVWPGVIVVCACIVSAGIFFGLRSSGPPVVPETDGVFHDDVSGVIDVHRICHAVLGEREDDD